MKKIDKFRILVLLKPGDNQPAIERANEFARFMPDIEVTACRIVNDFDEVTKQSLEQQMLRELSAIAKSHPNIQHFVPKILFAKNVPEAFVQEAAAGDYTMAIISANRRQKIKDLFISTIDSQVMRSISIPLLVVKDANAPQRLERVILLAIDFEEDNHDRQLDEVLFQAAKIFADEFNGEIHVANCVSPLNRGYMGGNSSPSKMLSPNAHQRRSDIHQAFLDEYAKRHGIDLAHTHVAIGRVDEEIPRLCAQLEARMVCMGSAARSGLLSPMNSSASELVLEQIKGDIFVVNDAQRYFTDEDSSAEN